MKKVLKVLGIIVVVLGLLAYFIGVPMASKSFVDLTFNFEPHTFDYVLNDTDLVKNHYYIEGKKSPADYGYKSHEEVTFPSIYDKDIQLSGWWIPAASDTAPVIILSHGRTANRLKPMRCLEIFKTLGLDSSYNFFLPDFRNSGNSSPAPTQLGNKFGEDIAATSIYLKEKYGMDKQIMYSFSMGAMASAVALGRADLKAALDEKGIVIERLIFDSPLSDAKGLLTMKGEEMNLPNMITKGAFKIMTKEITDSKGNSFFENMNFSTLLKEVAQPILFLHNEADKATPYVLLKAELDKLNKPNFKLNAYKNTAGKKDVHVRIMRQHKEAYEIAIKDFLTK